MGSIDAGQIRAPQLAGMFGPGSIVNLQALSVMPIGPEKWIYASYISSPTFEKQIGADRLLDTASLSDRGIDAVIFPRWFVCRKCGLIQRRTMASAEEAAHGFRCEQDRDSLYPSRWIVYCPLGHIDDFDYCSFAHDGAACDQRVTLDFGSDISHTFVSCKCGARRSMRDAYPWASKRRCSGSQPWLESVGRECGEKPKLSMKSASDIYFSAVRSAITIEPESKPLVREVIAALAQAPKNAQASTGNALQMLRLSYARFENVPDAELIPAIEHFLKAAQDPGEYRDRRYQEFEALSNTIGGPTEDLWVEEIFDHALESFAVRRLFAVRKLREVRALVGFQRGNVPIDPAFENADDLGDIQPLGNGKGRIYPAYENRGEGIFFRFDSAKLKEWLARAAVQQRGDVFVRAEDAWRSSTSRAGTTTRRMLYVAAHSFAHLTIRQLSLVSGYSQASLRERIFVSADDSEVPWAGVLIYTASSDADGSLGGLVAQAVDGQLHSILREGVSSLAVCSSDPVCALQMPIGFRKLNASACHSCLVLPETCCERNNSFLDRNTIVPHTVHESSHFLCLTRP